MEKTYGPASLLLSTALQTEWRGGESVVKGEEGGGRVWGLVDRGCVWIPCLWERLHGGPSATRRQVTKSQVGPSPWRRAAFFWSNAGLKCLSDRWIAVMCGGAWAETRVGGGGHVRAECSLRLVKSIHAIACCRTKHLCGPAAHTLVTPDQEGEKRTKGALPHLLKVTALPVNVPFPHRCSLACKSWAGNLPRDLVTVLPGDQARGNHINYIQVQLVSRLGFRIDTSKYKLRMILYRSVQSDMKICLFLEIFKLCLF